MPDTAIPLPEDWISRLVKVLTRRWVERRDEYNRIFNEFGDYEHLARTYVEPDCRTGNPADLDENEPTRSVPAGAADRPRLGPGAPVPLFRWPGVPGS